MEHNNQIKILPEYIANQIAAGEVVQRPESVVKELVENSLDAGATSIGIVVKGSGKTLIHVLDNGKGMSREDLELAPLRHSTSKILTQEDLEKIQTYGFRGEALASISAVASVEIRTKRAQDEHGWSLKSEPNQPFQISPVNCDNGTQVFVRNLFFNVPARKKFLKSDITEYRYITETVTRFAVIHYDKRLVYYDSDNLVYDLHPSSQEERIKNVFGENIASEVVKVDFSTDLVSIKGFIGKPAAARPTGNYQHLFVNQRPVVSKNLNYAIFAPFEHQLEKNYKPFYVINIEIDPRKVDINIHPQKHEVKFDDEKLIFSALHRAVTEVLAKYNFTSVHKVDKSEKSPFSRFEVSESSKENILVNRSTGEVIDRSSAFKQSSNWHAPIDRSFGTTGQSSRSAFDLLFDVAPKSDFQPPKDRIEISDDAQFLQIHNKYILMQSPSGVFIIDQHNAHERILYEKALRAMNSDFSNMQVLLFPISSAIEPSQIAIAREIDQELRKLGFDFKLYPDGKIEIMGVPLDISESEAISSFSEILSEYVKLLQIKHSTKRDSLAASYACRSAVKTGQKLSPEEMLNLARNLMQCNMPYVCPHGRPVVLEISLRELDKSFKRV
ncbi:MAG: DNA mismatch repair endonuclease MutL [Bacteroidota bacterium]